MKYKFLHILICITLFMHIKSYSQNLIPNPGFELYDTCPSHFFQFEFAHHWQSVEYSTDFFNVCEPFHIVGVPYNYFGYQPAHSGCSYAGLFSMQSQYNYIREYMQTQLISSLIIGTKYFISFYLSLGIGSGGWISATNKFGCKLSTISYPVINDNMPATNNQATFYTGSIITDTLNWVKISGSFIADSAYKYISFGNFFDSLHTQYIMIVGAPYVSSYYYIDDICLSTDSLTCVNVTDTCHTPFYLGINNLLKNELYVYPNPFSDYLTAENKNNNEELELTLRDLDGRVLWLEKFTCVWRKNLSYLTNGMYFFEVRKLGKLLKTGKMVKI